MRQLNARAALRALALALTAQLAACSASTTNPPDGGDSATTPSDASDSGTTPADGGGVCCPIEVSAPTCSAGPRRVGGWAPSPDQCLGGGYDGAPYTRQGIDSHGCPALFTDPCVVPCGVPADASFTPPAFCNGDAGADGG